MTEICITVRSDLAGDTIYRIAVGEEDLERAVGVLCASLVTGCALVGAPYRIEKNDDQKLHA